jgi:opacity protein-like surface antigen
MHKLMAGLLVAASALAVTASAQAAIGPGPVMAPSANAFAGGPVAVEHVQYYHRYYHHYHHRHWHRWHRPYRRGPVVVIHPG